MQASTRSPRTSPRSYALWTIAKHCLLIGLLIGVGLAPRVAFAELLYATSGNDIAQFDSGATGVVTSIPVTGLQAGESLVGIDLRPSNGLLYGIGSSSRVYTINPLTGAATQVGAAGAFTLNGTAFAVDFNPVPDRIRVISNTGQNIRINPNDGSLAATDTSITPGGVTITGAAYDRNFAGATQTTLYAIDSSNGVLTTVGSINGSPNSPNGGVVGPTVGSLGLGAGLDPRIGLDISSRSATAFATILTGGTDKLYSINLTTGAATLVGTIGIGTTVYSGVTAAANARISLVKLTNGTDNNAAPGPTVPVGSTVTFTYVVTNPGNVALSGVTVRDNNGTPGNAADDFNATFVTGDANSNGLLDPGETWTFTASRIATAGQYTNLGTAIATSPAVSASDPDNHFGTTVTVVTGTGGDDTLVLTATGPDSGSYSLNGGAAVFFTGSTSFTFNGSGGDDTFTINNPGVGLFAPSGGIFYDGGGQPGDNIVVQGGTSNSGTYAVGPGNGDGIITHNNGVVIQNITFTGLAPALDIVPETDYTVTATNASNIITLDNGTATGDGLLRISIDAFEPVQFSNKTNLIINGGLTNDDAGNTITLSNTEASTGLTTVTVNSGASSPNADVVNVLTTPAGVATTIQGQHGFDTVNVGNAGSVQGILGSVMVANSQRFSNLTVDDAADATARTVTIANAGANTAVTGLAPATISIVNNDTQALTINGGTVGNTFNANASASHTNFGVTNTINGGSGVDIFNIAGSAFTNNSINNFNGQGGNDTFNVTSSATAASGAIINIDGGAPTTTPGDTLNFDAQGQALTISPTSIQSDSNGVVNYTNIETINPTNTNGAVVVNGTGGNDALTVTATSSNSGTYSFAGGPAIGFSGITSFTFNGSGGDDTFTINNPGVGLFAPSGGIFYNGGGQPGDNLQNLLGTATTGTYKPGPGVGDGVITHVNGGLTQTITFTGLAPTTDTVAEPTYTISGTDTANTIALDNGTASGDGLLRVSIDLFEPIQFSNKTNVVVNGFATTAAADATNIFNIGYSELSTGLSSITINGGDAVDTFNTTAITGTLNLNGNGGSDAFNVTSTGGTLNLDGGAGTDTLTGPNAASTWNLTGSNTGNITGVVNLFSNIENLVGGTASDNFVFANGAGVTGTIDGGTGANTLDYSAYTTAVSANLGMNAASFVASLNSSQETPPTSSGATGSATLIYNNVAKTFDFSLTVVGLTPAQVTAFHIHQAPTGVAGPVIIPFSTAGLVANANGFTFTQNGIPLGALSEAALLGGGAYVNIHTAANPGGDIRGQLYASAAFTAAPGTATGTAGITNIANVTGGSAGDSLVGNPAANVILGNAGNNILVGGPGADTLTGGANDDIIAWNNGDGSDVMDGGAGNDLVQVNGTVAAGDDFTIGPNGTRVSFARTSGVPFTLDIGTAETLSVNGVGGSDTFAVNNLTGIANLTTINLNGNDGNDIFNVVPAAATAINVNGGPGFDTLNVDETGTTNPTFTSTGSNAGAYAFGNRQGVNFSFVELALPTNQPPINTVPGTQTSLDDAPVVFSPGNGNAISIADADSAGNAERVTLTVSNGTLTLSGTAGLTFISGTGTNDESMIFTGTIASINAALNGLTYKPPANFNGSELLTITTNDLGNTGAGGPKSATDTVVVNVSYANKAPVNTVPATQATNEDTVLTFSTVGGNAISITDVDAAGSAERVTLKVTHGTLTLANTTGLSFSTGDGNGDATMTFSGTLADINTALNGLTYMPDPDSSGPDTLTITTNDLGNTGTGGALTDTDTVTITVNAVNDAPVNTVPGSQTSSQDTGLTFSAAKGNAISIADVDAGSSPVQVTFTATSGTVTLANTTGLTITGGSNGSSTVTVTGTIANINNALSGLLFTPNAGFNGAASVSITTNDLGNSGAGGAKSAPSTVPITVTPLPRTLAINTVTLTEGNSGTSSATFTVTLSAASTAPVSVQFATTDGTATAGSDYTNTTGTLTFAPGQTSKTISVPVIGDTTLEDNETFFVLLSNPTGGTTLTNNSGAGTILNDDGPPALAISDASLKEGNSGTSDATFTVTLTAPSGKGVTVDYATADGTALVGSDYTSTKGTLTFAPGQTSKTINVPIIGDTTVEPDETFLVKLSNAAGAPVSRSQGTGTILNDDQAPATPVLSVHFSNVGNGDVYRSLPSLVGSVSETSPPANASLNVQVSIQRQSDGKYFTGSSWSASPTFFPATVANGVWTLAAGLLPTNTPNGQFLIDDKYNLTATATDNGGHSASATITLIIDHTPPTISITVPRDKAILTSLLTIGGKIADGPGGTGVQKVLLSLVRASDGKQWNGSSFVTPPTVNGKAQPVMFIAPGDAAKGTYARRSGLPTGADLTPGNYRILAVALDGATNRGEARSTFTIKSNTPPPAVAAATVALSIAKASAATSSVQLRFLGALEAESAGDVAHYSVEVNGQAVSIESAGYNATNYSVSLGLPDGALHAGDKVTVKWSKLSDARGALLSGQTEALTAR